jgi:hypothetical protein
MGLTELQPVLARLYTDATFREAFLADPAAFGVAHGLSGPDADAVVRLSVPQVEAFAGSLIAKRRNEVRKLLPVSCDLLGDRFPRMFQCHARRYVPTGLRKHCDDAVAFAEFVAGVCTRRSPDDAPPPLDGPAVDMLRYEAAWLRASDPACRWLAMRFDHYMERAATADGESTGVQQRQAGIRFHVWFRFPPGERLFHVVIRRPWFPRRSTRPQTIP